MNGWFIRLIMSYTSFTIHLPATEMKILETLMEKNPEFSRNALVKMCIREYEKDQDDEITGMKRRINALFKQNNPDWKRKKNLPYHFNDEYAPVANYTDFHGDGK